MEIRAQMRPDCEHEDVQPGVQVQGPPLQAAVAGGPGHPSQGPGGKGGWGRGGGVWGTKLDIANCYWSVELPPPPPWRTPSGWRPRGTHMLFCECPLAGTRRLGWSRPLFPTCCGTWGRGGVVVVQYLDDVLFVGHDPGEVATVTDSAARLLRQAGFLISEKSVFTPQRSLRWMGKDVDLAGCRVAPAASAVAAVVAAWVKLALRPYTYVALRRLLGKIGWLGRPGNLGGCFLAGAPVLAALGPALGLAHTGSSGARSLRSHSPVLPGLGAGHYRGGAGSARVCGRGQVCPYHGD